MNLLMVAIAVGVLLAVWVKVAGVLGMAWFVGLIGWACYVAAGKKGKGLLLVVAAGVAGMVWVSVLDMLTILTQHTELEWLAVGIAAVGVVMEARLSLLSYIPAGLCGVAILGSGGPMGLMDLPGNTKLGFAFVIGAVIGYIADWIGSRVSKQQGASAH
jgi:hypothetical protein